MKNLSANTVKDESAAIAILRSVTSAGQPTERSAESVMADLIYYNDPRLRIKSDPIPRLHPDRHHTKIALHEVFYRHTNAVGLSAPQIGIHWRMFLAMTPDGLETFINPELLSVSGKAKGDESCLSLPGLCGRLVRNSHIRIQYESAYDGVVIQSDFKGYFARIIQHELDHLDGILFIDRASKTKRRELVRIAKTRPWYVDAKA